MKERVKSRARRGEGGEVTGDGGREGRLHGWEGGVTGEGEDEEGKEERKYEV